MFIQCLIVTGQSLPWSNSKLEPMLPSWDLQEADSETELECKVFAREFSGIITYGMEVMEKGFSSRHSTMQQGNKVSHLFVYLFLLQHCMTQENSHQKCYENYVFTRPFTIVGKRASEDQRVSNHYIPKQQYEWAGLSLQGNSNSCACLATKVGPRRVSSQKCCHL